MEYQKHLYQILYPNPALVASQLQPQQFARHYIAGSTRYYDGKVIFAMIDPDFRHSYFDIETGLKGLLPHEDGRPKATKFISSYRVLEHMDFKSIQKLYLTTPEGNCLELSPAPYDKTHKPGFLRIFSEITPLRMLVLSNYDFVEFAKFITDPRNTKGAPKLFYTQLDLNIADFLKDFETNPVMHPPIPGLHPSKLRDAIHELGVYKNKHTKGLSLDSPLDRISYKLIRHGFLFASQEDTRFFPMPSLEEIEKNNYKFWRNM